MNIYMAGRGEAVASEEGGDLSTIKESQKLLGRIVR